MNVKFLEDYVNRSGLKVINFVKKNVENLFPGYFALVMATGALSIGTFSLGMVLISKVLLYINVTAYLMLWLLTIIRIINYFPRVISDLTSHVRGPGFFTLVAGTCILGSQLIIVANHISEVIYLWALSIVLWFIIMYTFFSATTVRKNKPTIAEGINGAWLVAAVATQSISILGTLLSPYLKTGQEVILFFSLCMYLLGCMLYLNIIALIFYRFLFVELEHTALTPPYWINMGAVAIITLAGSTLILHSQFWPFLVEIKSFIKGFTLFFWITATWWIPLLFILGVWRHYYHRYPLKYDPQYWTMAFPLAMYTIGTIQLAKALELPFLNVIPSFMVYIAMIVWFIGIIALMHHKYLNFRSYLKSSNR